MADFNSTIADRLADAARSGKEAKFIVNGVTYDFTPTGLGAYVKAAIANGSLTLILPTSNPGVAGALWNNAGTIAISAG